MDAIAPHLPAVQTHRVWPYAYWQFKRLFEQVKAAAGIDDPALTIHTTRHTCASKLASRGIPLHQLMAYGGWTSLASVQRYLHLHTRRLGQLRGRVGGVKYMRAPDPKNCRSFPQSAEFGSRVNPEIRWHRLGGGMAKRETQRT
jgi:hypothetical protein